MKGCVTPGKVWFQPAHCVGQMITHRWASEAVAVESSVAPEALDHFAAKSADGAKLVLRVVNPTGTSQPARFDIQGVTLGEAPARATTLAHDDHMDFNSLSQPDRIMPVTIEWQHEGKAVCEAFLRNPSR